MADKTIVGDDYHALPRKYKDMGDGSFAEVVYNGGTKVDPLWNTTDTICRPYVIAAVSGGAIPVTGQVYWIGGPGMVVPAGRTVRGIEWGSNAASVGTTHTWFVLGMPDDQGNNTVTVLATSKDDLATGWATNTAKKLSLDTADGGSGVWTALVDTPVYAGVVQVATTPATIRGIAGSASNGIGTPKWWGSGPAALTIPSDLSGTSSIASTSIIPCIVRLSDTTT